MCENKFHKLKLVLAAHNVLELSSFLFIFNGMRRSSASAEDRWVHDINDFSVVFAFVFAWHCIFVISVWPYSQLAIFFFSASIPFLFIVCLLNGNVKSPN